MSRPKTRPSKVREDPAGYYDRHGVLKQIVDEPVGISLEEGLREEVLSGRHKRRLKNISIKLDPAQIIAVRKLAVMKSIPYQTLIRHYVAEGIRRELNLAR